LRDVSYYVKRKQGFPSITDLGVADIFLGGTGLSFTMKLSTAEKSDRQNFFKVDKVNVDVKNFNIKLTKSKHKILFAFAKPILLKALRPAFQKAIEKAIKDQAHQLDSYAYQIKLEADRAQQEALENPEDAPNIYNRYVQAMQKKILQGKQKAQAAGERAGQAKVNMAITKQDSIFPDIHLPGGISSKATEYKELALKGDDWQSPIFKLGSASTTSDIPHAPQVTRKAHNVTDGGIRGPQNIGNTGSMTNQLSNQAGTTNGSATNGSAYGTQGFSNQVDQVFSKDGTPNAATNGRTNGTTLGQNNPVYSGTV